MKRIVRTLQIISFSFLGLAACNNSRQSTTEFSEEVHDTTTFLRSDRSVKKDTITYETIFFPEDTTYMAKVLTKGTFHSDEVWQTAEKENWFGVFKGLNDNYLSNVEVKTPRVFDVVLDEDSTKNKTGWEVIPANKDSCYLLISGLKFLTNHKIKSLILSKISIFPDEQLQIKYLGIDYNVFAKGEKIRSIDSPESFEVRNYKLYLSAMKDGQIVNELLASIPNFDDAMVQILFAGDIDGDGLLDLIIDTSRHYNVSSPTLYLSKPADKGHLLKVVGQHTSVGC